MKIKNIILLVTAAMMLASCADRSPAAEKKDGGLPAEIQAYLDIDWRTEYPKLKEIYFENGAGSPRGMPMYFTDTDGDGVYELLAGISSYARGGGMLFIYDCSNGKAVYKGCVSGGYSAAKDEYPDKYCNKNIADVYCDEKSGVLGLFTSVSYAVGGEYGYEFYFSTADKSGVYHSELIGKAFAATPDYSPPFDWEYLSASGKTDEESFREELRNILSGSPAETDVIEAHLDADIFTSGEPVSDEEYADMLSALKEEILGRK